MPETEQLISKMLGAYRIERLLGKSQLGAAYLASEPERGIRAMVTTFNFPEGFSEQARAQLRTRFTREGTLLTRLAHANIVPIYAFGEQADYLYLVTAFVKKASLSQSLKQQTRFTPQQTLRVLRQLASGLDYAHSQGVTHGMLSLTNVVIDDALEVGIAGFGLRTMLEVHGNAQSTRPLAHLSSVNGAFLGAPEYVAPERVLGLACDARVDIYALGVMLFALLSGVQPFRADTPLDIALQRLQQPPPLIHIVCPAVPEAFDLVIGRALERDPARRFQSAGELAQAFERVVNAQHAARQPETAPKDKFTLAEQATLIPPNQSSPDPQMTMPPTVNWFDDQVSPSGRWRVVQPLASTRRDEQNHTRGGMPGTEVASPYGTEKMSTPLATPAATGPRPTFPKAPGASLSGIDPFAWWSSHAGGRKPVAAPAAPARSIALRRTSQGKHPAMSPDQQGRRKVVKLAIAGVAAAGALTVGGVTFARLAQSVQQHSATANTSTTSTTSTSTSNTQATNASQSSMANTNAQPGAATTKTKPKTPGHTGAVVGSTTLALNSAHVFTNPADGVSSLLIHLSNGTFVACERTCTHEGVLVDYDPQQKMIVCPAHNAVFDPRNGFNHVSGPGNGPLPRVNVHVNADGTITTG